MAEWLKAPAWKACILLKVSRVRIPFSPPNNFMYNMFKKIFKKYIKPFKDILLTNFFLNIIFGKPREKVGGKKVEHIWPPKNFSSRNFLYYLIDKPLAKRGIFIPRHNPLKKINFNKYKTFHDEHVVVDTIIKQLNLEYNKIFFVDIGAGDGIDMSNTYLLAAGGAKGISIEYNESKFAMMAVTYRDLPNVKLSRCQATPMNICYLLKGLSCPLKIDVLNLDIDSYDYYILESLLKEFDFKILVLEINPIFPIEIDFTVNFPNGAWDGSLFQGMSLSMAYKLLNKFNYSIIHVNKAFVLAVKNDLILKDFPFMQQDQLNEALNKSMSNSNDYNFLEIKEKPTDQILAIFKEKLKHYEPSAFLLKKSGL